MSRARAQSGPTISLFPFLAVLLCTMGSLLVVLVIFSRSAKLAGVAAADAARAAAAAAAADERQELELAREELGWRIDHVRSMRDRTADDLAKARMQLAGTEENARQLADELDALARVVEALESEAAQADDRTILELERKLAEARKAYDEAKEKLAEKPPAYAVVPYEGANGTHRRPLYIECCIDGVFLQPEGIRFGPTDFEGPPGPGNPLASALRAAREHIAKNPGESGDPNVQPYPLLIVRPSGVMAYYAARESIQSWGSEFGYQFVDEDWTLTYPPRDAVLADAEMRAVEEARRRLEWLAQVRPPKRTKPATQYRAATTRGGVVSNSGPSVLGDQSRYDWTEEQANGNAGGPPGRAFNAAGDGSNAGGLASGEGGGDAILGNRYAGPSKFYSGGSGGGGGLAAGGSGGPRAEARGWATAARRGRVEAEQLAPEALLLPVLQVARRLMVTAKGRHRESRDRVPAAAEPLREQLVPPREVMARRPRAWPQARRAAQAVPPAPRPAAVPVLPGAAVVAAEVVLRCPASRRAVEPVRRVLLVPRARRPA
jgi:hypothetical protein